MKKKLLLVALFSMIFVTGCFGKKQEEVKELTPIEVLEKAVSNVKDIKSLEVVSTIKAKVVNEGTTVELNFPLTIAGSGVKDGILMGITLGDNPFIGSLEAYVSADMKNEEVELYFPSNIVDMFLGIENDNSKWLYVSTADLMDGDTEITIDEEKLEQIKNIDYKKIIGNNFIYVDSNEGINRYKFILNDKLFERLAAEFNGEAEEFDGEIKLDVYIDSKNYNITKLGFDIKELAMENTEDIESIEMLEEFIFTMEFKNVNNTTVKIPDNIKNNAISIEKYAEEVKHLVEG